MSGWRATEKHEYDYDKSGVKTKHNAYTAVSGDILKLKSSLTSAVDPETGLCTFATEYIYDDNGVKTPVTITAKSMRKRYVHICLSHHTYAMDVAK